MGRQDRVSGKPVLKSPVNTKSHTVVAQQPRAQAPKLNNLPNNAGTSSMSKSHNSNYPRLPAPGKKIPEYSTNSEVSIAQNFNQNPNESISQVTPEAIQDESIWTLSQGKKNKNSPSKAHSSSLFAPSSNRIPATKFTISQSATKFFSNPQVLAEEIIKHKKINQRNIKKAFLFGNLVVIATDDPDTKRTLEEDWPDNAFINGVKTINKGLTPDTKPIKIIIVVNQAIVDLDCQETKDQLCAQGVSEAHHIVSKINEQKNTGLIREVTFNKESAERLIRDKIKLGLYLFKVQYDLRVIQCYNCAKFSHFSGNCRNRTACANCAQEHFLKDFPNKPKKESTRCANYGEKHYACSRKCPVMENELKRKLMKLSPNYAGKAIEKRNKQQVNPAVNLNP